MGGNEERKRERWIDRKREREERMIEGQGNVNPLLFPLHAFLDFMAWIVLTSVTAKMEPVVMQQVDSAFVQQVSMAASVKKNAGQASMDLTVPWSANVSTELPAALATGAALAPRREWVQLVRKMVWTILNNQTLTAFQWVNRILPRLPAVHHLNFGREMYLLNHLQPSLAYWEVKNRTSQVYGLQT